MNTCNHPNGMKSIMISPVIQLMEMDQVKPSDPQMDKILQAVGVIRELDRESKSHELPIQVVSLFLYIASRNNCNKQSAEDALLMSKASASRNTDWLSRTHYNGRPGLNLIRKEVDPFDRRKSTLRLTRKGRDLVEKLTSILYD
tara:strand:+ start:268 stop:699 length:432 start_codon:yes stop_codon:yes gene_type:complete